MIGKDTTPRTNAERVRDWRDRLRDSGYLPFTIWLSPDTVKAINTLKRRDKGCTNAEIISAAVQTVAAAVQAQEQGGSK